MSTFTTAENPMILRCANVLAYFLSASAKVQQKIETTKFLYMKSALLQQILSIVAEICEISENEIRSHVKRQEVVDARNIFIYYCIKYGFPAASVAGFLGRARVKSVHEGLCNHSIQKAQSAAFRYLNTEAGKKIACIDALTGR